MPQRTAVPWCTLPANTTHNIYNNSSNTVRATRQHNWEQQQQQQQHLCDIVSRTCVAQCQSELERETVHFCLLVGDLIHYRYRHYLSVRLTYHSHLRHSVLCYDLQFWFAYWINIIITVDNLKIRVCSVKFFIFFVIFFFFSILFCKILFERCFFVIVFYLLNKKICVDDSILIPFVRVCLDFCFREVFVSGERETWIRRTAVIIVSFIGFSSEISTVWNR